MKSAAWFAWLKCTRTETWNACMPPPPLKHVQLYGFTPSFTCKGMWRCTGLWSWNTTSYCLKLIQMIEMSVDRDLPLCFSFHDVLPHVEEECGMVCMVYMRRSWNLECLHVPPTKACTAIWLYICTCKGMWRCKVFFSWNKTSYGLKITQMIALSVNRGLPLCFSCSWCVLSLFPFVEEECGVLCMVYLRRTETWNACVPQKPLKPAGIPSFDPKTPNTRIRHSSSS